ncbi:unnamed protein product [Oncorhynchus mykiss]|uniref:Uncharacterized protein n=1 Tax=Oncorhynchus mykiss TaxID=8022 RepID=A0A060WLK6_ONCMY|nr:unnamed protein product [Oncorhynchus mykiss]
MGLQVRLLSSGFLTFLTLFSQDDEGQTALHYASACEFADVVELLLQAGADPSMKDQEGSLPEEVTESSTISSLLRQYTAPKG